MPSRSRRLCGSDPDAFFLGLCSLRKINSPYRGTLSSYGYTLLVLFFLIHIQSPPVLPNLQRIPPTRPVAKEDMELDGHDIWLVYASLSAC